LLAAALELKNRDSVDATAFKVLPVLLADFWASDDHRHWRGLSALRATVSATAVLNRRSIKYGSGASNSASRPLVVTPRLTPRTENPKETQANIYKLNRWCSRLVLVCRYFEHY
jgi:hypothetical protein